MTKTIELKAITEKDIDSTLRQLRKRILQAIGKKGPYPFASRLEAFGKLTEEMHEVTREVHAKDWKKFDDELLDVATVCIVNNAGASKVRR